MTKTQQIIKEAVNKGYTVTENGVVLGLKGQIELKLYGKSRYPTISVNTQLSTSKVYGLPVHQLAAFCFYGEDSFSKDTVIRHLNGNVLDVSKENIVLGTHSENNLDKPKHKRIAAAKAARAAQGHTPKNAKLTKVVQEKIKALYYGGGISYNQLALKFQVSKSTISNLIKGVTYQ